MSTGQHREYLWFESGSHDLHEFLSAFPESVLGRCVAVSSFDSGPLHPSPEEFASGWSYRQEVTYIPLVEAVATLPYDTYDEWYVLRELRDVGPLQSFVNYAGFGLSDPELRCDTRSDVKQRQYFCNAERQRQMLFWEQVARIQPEACVLNGDLFILVTLDRLLHERVVAHWNA